MRKTAQVIGILMVMCLCVASCSGGRCNKEALSCANDTIGEQLSALKTNHDIEESNKKRVAEFYQKLFGDKDIKVIDAYIGDTYIQHNPALPDGKEALKQAVAVWFKGAPKETVDIQHIGADGNLVYIHTKAKMGTKTFSIIDIFRIENTKIVEHWDVMQEVPEQSANPHPMF